ncbi:MAG: orotate phosphoribosyltransferase [Halobacteriales archaeon]|nr:orotate phosphoribosyltransferase [Halobacteriales archaeon]
MSDVPRILLETGALKFGDFTLTSGQKSAYYVDVKLASTKPQALRALAHGLAAFRHEADLLAGMELGAVPLTAAVALETGLPYVILRKQARQHGTGKRIEGTFAPGQRVLLIEDVATTGKTMVESIGLLREVGLVVDRAACVVDREQGAAAALQGLGVELHSLVRAEALLRGRV